MKILVYGDVHWSTYSSIIRSSGDDYSTRLENVIKSVNWAEALAKEHSCEMIVDLGDFFDKPDLTSQELSALCELEFCNVPHYHVCGNHEIGSSDLCYNSSNIFKVIENHVVITKPFTMKVDDDKNIGFLPYIIDASRKSLDLYFSYKPDIIFSHNDISGIQIGSVVSKNGFSLEEINNYYCTLFINGHIHNTTAEVMNKPNSRFINCGNLTGQNFSEDALKYDHIALIVDTKTYKVEVFENPYAFNFYKLDFTKNTYTSLPVLKENAVVAIKCNNNNYDNIKEAIYYNKNIIASRIILDTLEGSIEIVDDSIESLSINHIEEFKKFILNSVGKNDDVISELEEICK